MNPFYFLQRLFSKLLALASNFFDAMSVKTKILSGYIYPYQSIGNVDAVIAALAPDLLCRSTFYLEAGANDGITYSNTFFLERLYKARGILVEPSIPNYLKLIQYRSSDNIFSNSALVPSSFSSNTVELLYSDLMTTVADNHDFDAAAHIATGSQFCRHQSFSFVSPALTISELLEQNSIFKLDFISLDIEGHELSILQDLDFERFAVKYFLIETRNPPALISYMEHKGYALIKQLSPIDFFFAPITSN